MMSKDVQSRRRAALASVVERAAVTGGLPYEELPAVRKVFRDRSDLVHALQLEWSQALWSEIDAMALDWSSTREAAALADAAWTRCAAANPVLRRLLDDYLHECGRSLDAVRAREQALITDGGRGRASYERGAGTSGETGHARPLRSGRWEVGGAAQAVRA